MTRLLHKIGKPEDDVQKINDNFDRIALDLADSSGKFSSVSSFSATILAGQTLYQEINIVDDLDSYVKGKLPFIPRYDVFIDVDNDFTRIYPAGGNISQATLHGVQIEVMLTRTTLNVVTNEKATAFMIFRNRSASNHDFYVDFDGFYVPAPEQGIATRGT